MVDDANVGGYANVYAKSNCEEIYKCLFLLSISQFQVVAIGLLTQYPPSNPLSLYLMQSPSPPCAAPATWYVIEEL